MPGSRRIWRSTPGAQAEDQLGRLPPSQLGRSSRDVRDVSGCETAGSLAGINARSREERPGGRRAWAACRQAGRPPPESADAGARVAGASPQVCPGVGGSCTGPRRRKRCGAFSLLWQSRCDGSGSAVSQGTVPGREQVTQEVTSAPNLVSTSASASPKYGSSARPESRSGSSLSTMRSGWPRRQISTWSRLRPWPGPLLPS